MRRNPLTLLLALAVGYAAVNLMAEIHRLPTQRSERDSSAEQAAESAALWLRRSGAGSVPAGPRTARERGPGILPARPTKERRALLLLSRADPDAVWFRYRLSYFVYPMRLETRWLPGAPRSRPMPETSAAGEHLSHFPAAAGSGGGAGGPPSRAKIAERNRPTAPGLPAVAFGSAAGAAGRTAFGELRLPTGFRRPIDAKDTFPSGPIIGRVDSGSAGLPRALQVALAIIALAAVVALGALALAAAGAGSIGCWWANLALAHLVGSALLAWVATTAAAISGRLLLWPVYLGILALLPFRRTALAFLAPGRSGHRRSAINAWELALVALAVAGVVTAICYGWMLGLDWDGYAIWQLKARAFAMDGSLAILRDPSHFGYAHLDYPLLVPLQTWWVYTHLGGANDRWAQGINLLFALDLLALFAAVLAAVAGRRAALLGLALLATLPLLIAHATSGFADVPMAACLMAVGALLVGRSRHPEPAFLLSAGHESRLPALALVTAGVVQVKNEGLLAAVVTLMLLLAIPGGSGLRPRAASACALAGVLLVASAPFWWLRLRWRIVGDMLAGAGLHLTPSLLLWRLGITIHGLAAAILRFGPRLPCWGLLSIVVVAGLTAAQKRRPCRVTPLWLLAGGQLLGYTCIYLVTPHPLLWHLSTSVDRLWLHIAPLLLLASLAALAGPERSAAGRVQNVRAQAVEEPA